MSNFTADLSFWQKMPDFKEILRKAICCSLNPQNHLHALIHKAYLRYLEAINVKMSPMVILLFIDMLTAYQVALSHVQLHVASANYKLLMATVQT